MSKAAKPVRLAPQKKTTRKRATFHLPDDLLNRVRNAVFWLSGPPVRQTLGALVEEALSKHMDRLEKKHNGGKPFKQRWAENRGGRPLGS